MLGGGGGLDKFKLGFTYILKWLVTWLKYLFCNLKMPLQRKKMLRVGLRPSRACKDVVAAPITRTSLQSRHICTAVSECMVRRCTRNSFEAAKCRRHMLCNAVLQ